jgi:hypothetical protein
MQSLSARVSLLFVGLTQLPFFTCHGSSGALEDIFMMRSIPSQVTGGGVRHQCPRPRKRASTIIEVIQRPSLSHISNIMTASGSKRSPSYQAKAFWHRKISTS